MSNNTLIDAANTSSVCDACGEGKLYSRSEMNEVEYKGIKKQIHYHFSSCNVCGSELVGSSESKSNKREMNRFKKEVDQLLSGQAIREFRESFRLSQSDCAILFGGGEVAFSRYELDDVIQSNGMDRLIRLCQRSPQNINYLAEMADVTLSDETINSIFNQLVQGRPRHASGVMLGSAARIYHLGGISSLATPENLSLSTPHPSKLAACLSGNSRDSLTGHFELTAITASLSSTSQTTEINYSNIVDALQNMYHYDHTENRKATA